MPDIPDRDALESQYARAVSRLLKKLAGDLLEALGDPPKLDNLDDTFWDARTKEALAIIVPFGERIFLDAATRIMSANPVGISWEIVNEAAADWASKFTFDFWKDLERRELLFLQKAISRYFSEGQNRGQLEDRIRRRYSPVRAEAIAVTEITRAAAQGEMSVYDELRGMGIEMTIKWATNNDELVCPICGPLNGKPRGDGWTEPPPAHPRCLPGDTLVSPIGQVAAGSERWYEGNIIVIETLENQLTVTPNHPILTPSGWVAAGFLQEGDYVLGYSKSQWESTLLQINDKDGITTIKDIFCALDLNGFWVPTAAPDFHGDGAGSNVAVIRPNSEIVNNIQSIFDKPIVQYSLIDRDVIAETAFSHFGTQTQFVKGDISPTGGIMSGFDLATSLLRGHVLPLNGFRLGLVTGDNAIFQQPLPKSPAIDTSLLGEFVLGFTSNVSSQKVIKVRNDNFSGHVYNLQTESGLYVAAGIITHNCRCWLNMELPKVRR